MRIFLAIVMTLTAANSFAVEGDWVFAPGDYTHDPDTGQRVTQFAPDAVAYYPFGRNYQRSGFRYNNSTLRIGNAVNRYTTVETWGNGAVALGATLLFQPYDDRGDDTYGPADYRRNRKRLHRDYHDVHRDVRRDRAREGLVPTVRDHRRPAYRDIVGPGLGGLGYGTGAGFGGLGYGGPGYGMGSGRGRGAAGYGMGYGGGAGFGASGYAANHGRVEWGKDSGSIEWGLDRGYQRNGYTYGYGMPWYGANGYRGGHRPRPEPHRTGF